MPPWPQMGDGRVNTQERMNAPPTGNCRGGIHAARPGGLVAGAAFMPPAPYKNITTSSSFGLAPLNASSK